MSIEFSITSAQRSDVPAIHNLIGQLAVYERLEHMFVGSAAMLEDSLFGAAPACQCVIAKENGVAVGFALFFITYSTFLCKPGIYLEDVFVIPTARGRGYGKALLRFLATLAHEQGFGRFEWRVLDWNTPSIEFYKSLGASILPEWHLVRMTAPEIADFAAGTPSSN